MKAAIEQGNYSTRAKVRVKTCVSILNRLHVDKTVLLIEIESVPNKCIFCRLQLRYQCG